jgi:hypothetical protein
MKKTKPAKEDSMNCPRCDRMMILRKFYDYGGYAWAWKCVFCGEMTELPQKNFHWSEEIRDKIPLGEKTFCEDM